MAQLDSLPRWDMTPIFPSLDSPEFSSAFDQVKHEVQALVPLFEAHWVRRRDTRAVDAPLVQAFEEVTGRLNALYRALRTVWAYLGCFVATDASDDAAQAPLSELQMTGVTLDQLRVRYTAWVGSTDVEALLAGSPVAREHEYMLRKAQVLARHQMGEGEEDLAADLLPSSLRGWARLHHDVSALLSVTLSLRGESKALPMSSVRALASDPDREVRRAAYEAELEAWESVAVPLAAALNGVKGYQQVMHRRRGYRDDVEPTLLENSIDRGTLDSMQQACIESFPDFRRYLHAKARALGLPRLAWYDLEAPVGETSRAYTWPEAEAFIREQFGRYSERLAAFADRSFRESWIDAEPRAGKEGGGFCTLLRPGESRILMNYDGSFGSVSTLAHERGTLITI